MTLLLGSLLILLKNLVDDRQKPRQFPFLPRLLHLIPGRFLVLQNPLQRSPLQLVLLASRPPAQLSCQHTTPNFNPLIHVLEHLSSSQSLTVVVVLPNQISVTNSRVRPRTRLLTILRRSTAQALAFSIGVHITASRCHFSRNKASFLASNSAKSTSEA